MELNTEYSQIQGWGIDANPQNDPTYPFKQHTEDEHEGYTWKRPVQQPLNVEVLHSNERPGVSAVFGTSAPPKGLSGIIRRYAFHYSEGSFGHWVPLLVADRINVVEGVLEDLFSGRIPNFFIEKGGRARWKYDRKSVIMNISIGTFAALATIGFLLRNKLKSSLF